MWSQRLESAKKNNSVALASALANKTSDRASKSGSLQSGSKREFETRAPKSSKRTHLIYAKMFRPSITTATTPGDIPIVQPLFLGAITFLKMRVIFYANVPPSLSPPR